MYGLSGLRIRSTVEEFLHIEARTQVEPEGPDGASVLAVIFEGW